jgi:PAS domain S-box-containing protein
MSRNKEKQNKENLFGDIRELESYIREFSAFLPLPVCLVTPAHIIIDINNAFKRMTGYNEGEIIGQQVEYLFKNKRSFREFVKEVFKRKESKIEMELLTKDKDIIVVNVSAALRRDIDNNIVGYFLALSDITELKKLQTNLREKVKERTRELEEVQKVLIHTLEEAKAAKKKIEIEKNKTAAIIANLLDPVIVVNNQMRIILINPAAERVFNLSHKVLGRQVKVKKKEEFSLADFRDIIKVQYRVNRINEEISGKYAVEEVIIGTKEKGKEKEISPFQVATSDYRGAVQIYKVLTANVCNEKGNCFGVMKIFYDLTREKMIDQLKSEFISIAAHQLRTPLSAIKWAIRLVLDGDMGPLNDKQKKVLLRGYISNERVINLINDMLNVSRIEEGKFGYNFTVENFGLLLDEVVKNFSEQIKSKNLKFIFKRPKRLPTVKMDRKKIKLVLENILENAIKYTPGHGTVELKVSRKGEFLKVEVKDNGIGIPTEEQEKLFTKFFRSQNVVRVQTEGSGLGLFIAYNIIKKHNGEIVCKSDEGKGTTIIFTLPLTK